MFTGLMSGIREHKFSLLQGCTNTGARPPWRLNSVHWRLIFVGCQFISFFNVIFLLPKTLRYFLDFWELLCRFVLKYNKYSDASRQMQADRCNIVPCCMTHLLPKETLAEQNCADLSKQEES